MAGPWVKFQTQPAEGPWTKFAKPEQQPTEDQPSVATDVAASGASGAARGTADLLGLPGTIGDALNTGMGYALKKGYEGATGVANFVTGNGFTPSEPEPGSFFGGSAIPSSVVSGDAMRDYAAKATNGATDYQPKTTAGEYARTVGEFLPGAVAFGGLNPVAIGRNAILPAVASESAGQLTEETGYEPYARVAGALIGGAAPSLMRRSVTPLPVSTERKAMIDVLKREGVDLTAGQATGRKSLQAMESELGGGAAASAMEKQGEQFTAAVLKKAGITDASRATPEVIDNAYTRIGKQFDDLSARNTVSIDQQAGQELGDTLRTYQDLVGPANVAPVIQNTIADIAGKAAQGPISGEFYKTTASRLARLARSAKDPELKNALLDIRSSLDDAMERSIASTNPSDLGAFREARGQYRNLLAITQAATGAGENAALGLISPQSLRQAAVGQGRSAYARGQGDFADLSHAGNAIMSPLPNSGTPIRLAARGAGAGSGALIGALLTGGNPIGAGVGALASPILNAGIGRALLSAPVRAYLGNQVAAQAPNVPARVQGLIRALLQSDEARQQGALTRNNR